MFLVLAGPGGPVLDVPSSRVVVSDVTVRSAMGSDGPAGYDATILRAGEPYYTDRAYKATHMPPSLEGLTAIKTAEADKSSDPTDSCWLSFTVVQPAQILLWYDARAIELPDWLQDDYVDEAIELYEETFENSDGNAATTSAFRLYRRHICGADGDGAGGYPCKVCIGGNGGGNGDGGAVRGVHSNYLVVVAADEDRVKMLESLAVSVYAQTRGLSGGGKLVMLTMAMTLVAGLRLRKSIDARRQTDWRAGP
jgi:hypothetical protein